MCFQVTAKAWANVAKSRELVDKILKEQKGTRLKENFSNAIHIE